MKKNLLVIGAHSGDFVWRAAGTIARSVEEGAKTLGDRDVLWRTGRVG